MQCLKIGEPDKEGNREYVWEVEINHQPIMYNVRARSEGEAKERLRPYIEMDAASMQEMGVVGTSFTVIVVVGAMVAGVAALGRHLQGKPIISRPVGKRPKPKKNPLVNGSEIEDVKVATDANVSDGAPDDTAVARVRSMSPFRQAARAATRAATWRPINYNGAQGRIAGDDPTQALKIVVFSDQPVDPFLSLARPSLYDAERSMMKDAIAVLAFPSVAAINMRPQGAFEVMVGGTGASREFDVSAPTPEAALGMIREKLARYL